MNYAAESNNVLEHPNAATMPSKCFITEIYPCMNATLVFLNQGIGN